MLGRRNRYSTGTDREGILPQIALDHRKPLVVLGMPHSGGSSLAGALARFGVFFGRDADLFAPTADDPDAAFVNKPLSNINLRCLGAFQMHPASVFALPPNWACHPLGPGLLEELKAAIATLIQPGRRWGLALPTAGLLMPMYRSAFEELELDPHYLVCVRDPLDLAHSSLRLAHEPNSRAIPLGDLAVGVWLRHTLGALEVATPRNSSIVMSEDLTQRPRAVLEGIVSLDPSWQPTQGCWSAATAALRQEHLREAGNRDDYPALVQETLEACRQLANGKAGYERLAGAIVEFGLWQEIFAKPGIPGTQVGLAWTQRGEVRTAQVPFLPAGDWQTVRLAIDSAPGTPVFGLLYGQPCRAWIRRCAWIFDDKEESARLAAGPGSQLHQVDGLMRLDGAYESRQMMLQTPRTRGPYTLEIEFWLEAGPQISIEAASRLSSRLRQCIAYHQQVSTGGKP